MGAHHQVTWQQPLESSQQPRSLVASFVYGVVCVWCPWTECLWEVLRCQVVWTKDTLPELLELVGFRVVLHEYYDSKGKFHMNKVSLQTDRSPPHPPRASALSAHIYTPMRSTPQGFLNPRPES